ncbi:MULTISPECIES: OFA family MFS transporter [unclassified Coleofasciculus]|uniref:L-lactate MFS transporter n=1 Tax=unclassified Coleofasciculus TaxID=2692782 RepID=UPI001881B955|nr:MULTISPECIES: OFA family MFS transporter [unclassified Coleofasciculus]MBE9129500.1 OFA family MFS transporter [Coleofasciculus sp. LEGE 07081]MBE9152086.1 OFA family MFS transporter [Coleofasciculus sp. LEGE 07092]
MNNWQSVRLFGLPAEKGRWFLIPLGSLVLLCLGTVYSWSIFRKPLEDLFGISATQSLLPFTFLLVLYALLMPVTGFYIDRIGVGKITAIGGVVTGIGYILSSLTTNIILLTITYGVIAGAGVGIAYGIPLAVSAKWFPDRKGLAVGSTAIGFGLSPLVTAPLAKSLIAAYGVLPTFTILGISLTAIILVISITLKLPPKGWKPQGWTPRAIDEISESQRRQLWQSPSFYALWLCYTIGSFVGLSAIGISSPVAQEIIKLDATTAAITVSIFAVFNGIGRPLFGWLTDRLQPKGAATISYVLILIASILMLNAGEGQALTYLVAFSLFWLCLGGWLAIAPTATLNLFDPEDYAKNYGIVFTAYGAGALLGTLATGQIRDLFGSYTYAFYLTAILAVIGIIIAQFKLQS